MPIPCSLITVFGPIPGTRPGDSAAKRSRASSRESTTSPAGLPSSLTILASIRLSEIPTEQVSPVSRADLGRDPPHRRLRREDPGQVQVGLVEPDHLDRLDVAPQHLHHLRRGLAVGGEVRRQIDRVRQSPPRHRRRHRRVDPGQLPRLIARRRHHRPRPRPADHHRLPPQLRPLAQLDRRVEGVHIQMCDHTGPVGNRGHKGTIASQAAARTRVRVVGDLAVDRLIAVTQARKLLSALLTGILLAGCGSGSDNTAGSRPVASEPLKQPSFRSSDASVRDVHSMTQADSLKNKKAALHNGAVSRLSADSRIRASTVIPWVSEGGGELLGGVIHIHLSPVVDFDDQKLPATISPNQKAPPGTPTLHRFVRMSATNVSELEVQVELANQRVVRIEPSGTGYQVTKVELIGPPPANSAYAPEPGY